MKSLLLSAVIVALTASTALAARGDNSEGQGGGSSTPRPSLVTIYYTEYQQQWVTEYVTEPYQETRYRTENRQREETRTETRTRTVQVEQEYIEVLLHTARLSDECTIEKKDERFDDFSTGCKIIPSWNEDVTKTKTVDVQQQYTVDVPVTVTYQVQVPYQETLYRQVPVQKLVDVPVQKSRQEWQCPSPYKVSTYTEKGRTTRTCVSGVPDRGNSGNR